MRVQIFAPIAGGPLTQYVSYLLPTLVELHAADHIGTIGVTLSRSHFESPFFSEYLAPYAGTVEFDIFDDEVASLTWRSGVRCTDALLRSVGRLRPDFLVSVSANYGAVALGLRALGHPHLRRANTSFDSIGIFHHGMASAARGVRARARALIQRAARDLAPWSEIHVVNPLLYDAITRTSPGGNGRVKLVPHPLARRPVIGKAVARERLGVPRDGRYLAYVGKTDPRKAIPELLAAFRNARLAPTDRLLLAGRSHSAYRELADREYGDLIASGRVVLIDRYLRDEELHDAYCAADVVAVPYYPMDDLSANLLAAIAAERPVLANDFGYAGTAIRRFALGWACDILDPEMFAKTVERAFRQCDSFALDDRALRLLEYHDPQNYADTVLLRLRSRIGIPQPIVRSWDWVDAGSE